MKKNKIFNDAIFVFLTHSSNPKHISIYNFVVYLFISKLFLKIINQILLNINKDKGDDYDPPVTNRGY